MVAEDVADDEFASVFYGGGDDFLGFLDGFCEWFFDKDIASCLDGGDGVGGVGVWVGGDGYGVGFGLLECLVVVVKERVAAAEFLVEFFTGCCGAGADAGDIEFWDVVVGEGV